METVVLINFIINPRNNIRLYIQDKMKMSLFFYLSPRQGITKTILLISIYKDFYVVAVVVVVVVAVVIIIVLSIIPGFRLILSSHCTIFVLLASSIFGKPNTQPSGE